MKKIILTLILIVAVVISSCDLFDGVPKRDNINDPGNELGYDVNFIFSNTLTSVGVHWDYEDSDGNKHEIYYGAEDDFNKGILIQVDEVGSKAVIDELTYGEEYNIWLKAINKEDGETVFLKHAKTVLESVGEKETGFSGDGIHIIMDNNSGMSDVISVGNGEFFVGGYYNITATTEFYNLIFKMASDGSMVSEFAAAGRYQGSMVPSSGPDLNLLMNNNSLVAFTSLNSTFVQFIPDFSVPGYQTTSTELSQMDAILDAESSVLACGFITAGNNFAIKRLSSDLMGETQNFILDSATQFPGATGSAATSIALSNDNSLYVAGYVEFGSPTTTYLGRFNYSSLAIEDVFAVNQTSWGDHGTKILTAVMANGNVLLAANERLGLFNKDNFDVESGFGNNGIVEGIDSMFIAADLMVQPNGKILLVGTIMALDGCVYRFNPDGSLDTDFGTDGAFIVADYFFNSIDHLSDGHLAIAGRDHATSQGIVMMLK